MMRVTALLRKDLAEVVRNPGMFMPAVLIGVFSLAMPFILALGVPYFTGEPLSDSSDFDVALEMYRNDPTSRSLDPEAAVQAWLFQQILVLLTLAPVGASMSIAAFSVIGEKQARSLEPLLATPITTFELLLAKVASALIPSLLLSAALFALYIGGISTLARPGVAGMLLTPVPVAIMFLVGPLSALAALQLAVCASSRVNDPRSAQQIGALIILPLGGLLAVQLAGGLVLGLQAVFVIAGVLAGFNLLLMWVSTLVFDRETILTRWT